MKLYTIGFAKKNAETFFGLLEINQIKRLIDIRESNTNIYAGFTMKQNLPFFLDGILNIDYIEMKLLAPTKELRKQYHENIETNWAEYESGYIALLEGRKVKTLIEPNILNNSVLLCSEPTPEKCHRRLAAEYMKSIYKEIEIIHL